MCFAAFQIKKTHTHTHLSEQLYTIVDYGRHVIYTESIFTEVGVGRVSLLDFKAENEKTKFRWN